MERRRKIEKTLKQKERMDEEILLICPLFFCGEIIFTGAIYYRIYGAHK